MKAIALSFVLALVAGFVCTELVSWAIRMVEHTSLFEKIVVYILIPVIYAVRTFNQALTYFEKKFVH